MWYHLVRTQDPTIELAWIFEQRTNAGELVVGGDPARLNWLYPAAPVVLFKNYFVVIGMFWLSMDVVRVPCGLAWVMSACASRT